MNWKNGISKDKYRYKKIQKQRYPERVKARNTLHRLVKTNKIQRPNFCSDCGIKVEKENIQGHHKDYNQPLKVEWLCRDCHKRKHKIPEIVIINKNGGNKR